MSHPENLARIAKDIRINSIKSIYHGRSGHPGGSLSIAELLSVLYFDEMNVKANDPDWIDRDRLVLSKGHACPALYSALALKGYFDIEEVKKLRHLEHYLEGHPEINIPGIDAVSGSLGMGLSQALGMALGAKYTKKQYRSYVILGDGDMQEGNTWEAIMAASHHQLDNLVAILDSNGLQGDASVEQQMNTFPIVEKLSAFQWNIIDIDGHDIKQLQNALKNARETKNQPTFICANTIKGKGIHFMENVLSWHGSVTMNQQQLEDSLAALEQ
ncbi:MAG: transketolase [Methylococcales bacterium]|jgi:transketolase|nr:transketolase [Methylococcales bacterium]MBT7408479.1 transketolase [Methylococcales bacterium]